MPFSLNRSTLTGLFIAVLTALIALYGAPAGFEGFRIPIWELLLQFNFCTGFIFLCLGVLESVETPLPDVTGGLQLLLAGFVVYAAASLFRGAHAEIQLFLFTSSLACVGAGWARGGLSVLRQLDTGK